MKQQTSDEGDLLPDMVPPTMYRTVRKASMFLLFCMSRSTSILSSLLVPCSFTSIIYIFVNFTQYCTLLVLYTVYSTASYQEVR